MTTASLDRLRQSTHMPVLVPPNGIACYSEDAVNAFLDLCHGRCVHVVFQPILDFHNRGYLGFEGLVRGPVGSELYSPGCLFALAHKTGLGTEFERLCRDVVLTEFARAKLPGLLFLNASINGLTDPHFMEDTMQRQLQKRNLQPRQIIIELTESQQVTDFSALNEVLDLYRRQGYRIAIDDLGEGFANLRIWSEVRPDYVKIDRHFISGIADDGLKFHLVRAMHDLAESTQVHLIAEGIETEAELATVRDLGIAYGQGYLIAYPESKPEPTPKPSILGLLQRGNLIVFPRIATPSMGTITARALSIPVAPIGMNCDNATAFSRFEQDAELLSLPVVDADHRPLGLINRYALIDRFARLFRRELFGRKSCALFMNEAPIIVDHTTLIQDIGQRLSQSAHHHLVDGFIVTEQGRYLGVGSSQALMAMFTDLQLRAARYANPLTQLPGNVPINEHIERLLKNATPFVACYCDLDHFKPYNDVYGYRSGDILIQFLGSLLGEICDSRLDFVGHIGGDDFLLLLQSPDWQQRVNRGLKLFDEGVLSLLDPQHIRAGGYQAEDRKGRLVFHPLPALSIGCLCVGARMFHSHHEVSAAVADAKKQAKKIPGSALFIERRRVESQQGCLREKS